METVLVLIKWWSIACQACHTHLCKLWSVHHLLSFISRHLLTAFPHKIKQSENDRALEIYESVIYNMSQLLHKSSINHITSRAMNTVIRKISGDQYDILGSSLHGWARLSKDHEEQFNHPVAAYIYLWQNKLCSKMCILWKISRISWEIQ